MEKVFARGGFGEVRLERSIEGGEAKVRAVKRIATTSNTLQDSDYEKELKALLEFSKPKVHRSTLYQPLPILY